MSVVMDNMQALAGLAERFARLGATDLRVFELPRLPDYIPDGGVGFIADFAAGTTLFDIIGLELDLEQELGRKVLVMDYQDKGYYVTDEMIAQAERL